MSEIKKNKPLLLAGLTPEQRLFLKNYGLENLSSTSMTKAIHHLINEKMGLKKPTSNTYNGDIQLESVSKKRIQISINENYYNQLVDIANSTDSSIHYYITRLIINDLSGENIKLLGSQITELRKFNYELKKIGINLNQIAYSINRGDENNISVKVLENIYKVVEKHVAFFKLVLCLNRN